MSAQGSTRPRNRFSLILQLGLSRSPDAASSPAQPSTSPSTLSSPISGIFSSPRLLAASSTFSSGSEGQSLPAPVTTNHLGVQEKTRLLKKARKLSHLFGEVPITESGNEAGLDSQAEDSSIWSRKRISRNTSLGIMPHRTLSSPSRSAKARPPLLHVDAPVPVKRVASAGARPSSHFSITEDPHLLPIVSSPQSAPNLDAHLPDVRVSLTRSSMDSRSGRSQTRSGSQRAPPSSPYPADDFSSRKTRSTSLPRNKIRKSMESPSTSVPALPRHSSSSRPSTAKRKRPTTATSPEQTLRKSRSMWAKEGQRPGDFSHSVSDPNDRAAIIRDLKENSHFGESQRMTKVQRSQSVKRARKLNKVFGSEPPQALYQISAVVEHSNRDSVATFLSISSADLLSASVHTSRAGKHQSFSSSISRSSVTSEPSSPVVASTPLPSSEPPPRQHRRNPSTPAPFQDYTSEQGHGEQSVAHGQDSLSHTVDDADVFRQKRMRAAKLSRFFGVDIHDVAPSLDIPPPLPRGPHSPLPTLEMPEAPQNVDVRIQQSHKFWSRADKEVDMSDVISRLREMR